MDFDTIYFVGYAKLPSCMSASKLYTQFTLGAKINIKNGLIEDVSCTLISSLAQDMVRSYLVNRHILYDFNEIVKEISIRHQGNASKAIIKSFSDIKTKYMDFCERYRTV